MENTNIKKQQVAPFFEVHECLETGYQSMYATRDLSPFTVLSKFGYHGVFNEPTRFTVQVSENQHIQLKPTYLQYINHSCRPNVFFDTRAMMLSTVRPILCGEEVTFFYPSTEWKMTEPFDCLCRNDNCLGRIQGAAYLGHDNLSNYRLSDYIIHKYGRLPEIQHQRFTQFKLLRTLDVYDEAIVT